MQFKQQGNRVQVLAYRGYDKEKRRSVVKMLGSIDRRTYKPTDRLLESLTADEKAELQSYIEQLRQADEKEKRLQDCKTIASRIKNVSDAIEDEAFEPDEAWAREVYDAFAALKRAMRKQGLTQSALKPPKNAASAALPGQAGLPLGEEENASAGVSEALESSRVF